MLELHCAGRFDDVNLFLQFFPEYLQGIQDMTGVRIPKLINTLYYYYHHCKVKKQHVPNMEKWIHRALYKIHGVYLKMVEDGVEKPFITKQIIFQEYVSKLPFGIFKLTFSGIIYDNKDLPDQSGILLPFLITYLSFSGTKYM